MLYDSDGCGVNTTSIIHVKTVSTGNSAYFGCHCWGYTTSMWLPSNMVLDRRPQYVSQDVSIAARLPE